MSFVFSSAPGHERNALHALSAWHGKYRLAVLALCTECTFGGSPAACPLCEMRKLPIRDRVARLAGLGERRCEQLYFNHLGCMQRRVAAETRAGTLSQPSAVETSPVLAMVG